MRIPSLFIITPALAAFCGNATVTSRPRRMGLLFVAGLAFVTALPTATSAATREETIQAGYAEAVEAIRAGKVQDGAAIMVPLVESGDYMALAEVDQAKALTFVAAVVARTNENKAYEYFKLAASYPQPELMTLVGHASLAGMLNHNPDAVDSLLKLRQRTPMIWTEREDRLAFELARRFQRANDKEAEYDMLNRLYTVGYKTHTGTEPNALWLRFVELLLASGENGRAAIVAGRISSPRTLSQMRIDKRFDPIVEVNPALLDVRSAIAAQIEDSRNSVTRLPRSLRARIEYLDALNDARQYEEVIAFSDTVIQAAAAAVERPAFDDAQQINWIWDYKARALAKLHRYEEAEQAWLFSSRLPESNSKNVSQILNLAGLYVDLERYEDAIRMLEIVGTPSAYGKIQVEVVQLRAAVHRGDRAAFEKSLVFIRENRADSPFDYIESSLLTGGQQDAASYLIDLLNDEAIRGTALSRLQRYADVEGLPLVSAKIETALRTLIQQPDVAATIDKWGRIEDVPLPAMFR